MLRTICARLSMSSKTPAFTMTTKHLSLTAQTQSKKDNDITEHYDPDKEFYSPSPFRTPVVKHHGYETKIFVGGLFHFH